MNDAPTIGFAKSNAPFVQCVGMGESAYVRNDHGEIVGFTVIIDGEPYMLRLERRPAEGQDDE